VCWREAIAGISAAAVRTMPLAATPASTTASIGKIYKDRRRALITSTLPQLMRARKARLGRAAASAMQVP
jgi:hypothetical protein